MKTRFERPIRFGLALGAAALPLAPMMAFAQTQGPTQEAQGAGQLAQLEALSDAALDEQTGLALAREQASRGEVLEALATLSRVLAVHPKSNAARLLEVYYLCKSDDRLGASVALGKIKRKAISQEARAMIEAECRFEQGGAQ